MSQSLGLESEIVDSNIRQRAIEHLKARGVLLPTFAQLADPSTIPEAVTERLQKVSADAADPSNLFRVHWYNDSTRHARAATPQYAVLPKAVTGVDAKIIVAFGDGFPMIGAHKVLAAYACLAPRIVTGQFDPQEHRALWPSTGNYCRGGVAISRSMGCHGVAILPEGMSQERFEWLERWVLSPEDIIRTPGTESNVKEIYDKCAELSKDRRNVILNQFCEFGNHLAHYLCTGHALGDIFENARETGIGQGKLQLAAYVSASGSGGTLAAGDYLKERYGAKIVAVEAEQCPTMLENGFGEHNIQGIGDKHIPLIHNVMNTDLAVAISDRATDSLGIVFGSPEGRRYLAERRSVSPEVISTLERLGLSGICNVLAAIKTARYLDLGSDEAVITVATDSSALYGSERQQSQTELYGPQFDQVDAAEAYGQHVLGQGVGNVLELSLPERRRVFNLGYYTWVEQQGVSLEDFNRRRQSRFWRSLRDLIPAWDAQIDAFNGATGLSPR